MKTESGSKQNRKLWKFVSKAHKNQFGPHIGKHGWTAAGIKFEGRSYTCDS